MVIPFFWFRWLRRFGWQRRATQDGDVVLWLGASVIMLAFLWPVFFTSFLLIFYIVGTVAR